MQLEGQFAVSGPGGTEVASLLSLSVLWLLPWLWRLVLLAGEGEALGRPPPGPSKLLNPTLN